MLFSVLSKELARAVSASIASDALLNVLRVCEYRQTADNRKRRENVRSVPHSSLCGRGVENVGKPVRESVVSAVTPDKLSERLSGVRDGRCGLKGSKRFKVVGRASACCSFDNQRATLATAVKRPACVPSESREGLYNATMLTQPRTA